MNAESISTSCPACSKALLAPNRMAGRWIKCPRCSQTLRLPDPHPPEALATDKLEYQAEDQTEDWSNGSEPLELPEPDPLPSEVVSASYPPSPSTPAPAANWQRGPGSARPVNHHKVMLLVSGLILAIASFFFFDWSGVQRHDVVGDWMFASAANNGGPGNGATLTINNNDTFIYSAFGSSHRTFSGRWALNGRMLLLTVETSNGSPPGIGDEAKWKVVRASGSEIAVKGDGLPTAQEVVFRRQ